MISRDRSRPDRNWDWGRLIPVLIIFGGRLRRGRLFQMTVGSDQRPAAMVALLENERWPADHLMTASFLWFVSTAPRALLETSDGNGSGCTPRLVGRAARQIAVIVALSGAAEGRLWLHADPRGGQPLFDWYSNLGMAIVDPQSVPILPGYNASLPPRTNDGRYFCLDAAAAQRLHDEYSPLKRYL